jgi:DHA1 family tetracycline resistance protein-like MFS transporter
VPGEPRKATVAFVLIVILLDTLGIGLVLPVLPRIIERFLHGNLERASHTYGLFLALYAVMQFVFAPIVGGLSDRFGRRTVILTSLAGAACDYVLLAFAPTLGWLFVGRILAGMTGASFAAATAYIADVTPPEKRAASFGLVGAAFGVGFVLGPGLGGLLGGVSLRAPFLAAAALNLVNFLYGVFVLPESLGRENRRPFAWRRANPLGAIKNLGRSPIVRGLTATIVCSYLAQQLLRSTWALYTEARFGWSPGQVGLSLVCVGVAAAVVQGVLLRKLMPLLGERRAMLFGIVASVLGYAAIGLANRSWMLYVLVFPFALEGLIEPSTKALLTREVGATEQGELQGSLGSLLSMTSIVGPIAGTALFARFAPAEASPHVPGAVFLAGALLNVIGLLLAVRLFARRAPAPAPSRCPDE